MSVASGSSIGLLGFGPGFDSTSPSDVRSRVHEVHGFCPSDALGLSDGLAVSRDLNSALSMRMRVNGRKVVA